MNVVKEKTRTNIGADAMGAMGAIATRQKSCGAMPQSRSHGNFDTSPLYTSERYSKNYGCVIIKVKKVRQFQPENAP